jgi:hypothetical protein
VESGDESWDIPIVENISSPPLPGKSPDPRSKGPQTKTKSWAKFSQSTIPFFVYLIQSKARSYQISFQWFNKQRAANYTA